MYYTIVVIVVLAAILMCLIVLIQESKGGGLASSVSEANSMMGVRKTTDVVEKTTWALAGIMIVLSVLSVVFIPDQKNGSVIEETQTQQATSANNMPAIPQSQQAASGDKSAAGQSQQSAPAQQPAAPASK